jgi:predicted metalloprotease with PDZ domain
MKFPQIDLVFVLSIILIATKSGFAQSYQYELTWPQPETHYFEVKLTTQPETGESTVFQLPRWRPGRYELMNYSAGITAFKAENENGETLEWTKVAPSDWKVENPKYGNIVISYQFYANVMDAGSSVLNEEQAYFNGINLFMHVRDRYGLPCVLRVPDLPSHWKVASALEFDPSEKVFHAEDYHQLVDAPTILSPTLKTLTFKESNVNYYIHYQGNFAAGELGENLIIENTKAIVREQSSLFNGVPFDAYHFIFEFVPEMIGHAVEHSNSSCYVLAEAFTPDTSQYKLLYNVISHEFFHLWNVKRIRPAALWPYHYQSEPFTGLHWFTEGVTSYYADLILVRSGIISRQHYYQSLARIISQMENSYAEKSISPYQSSIDSWLQGSNYAHPDLGISYYALGHRLGILLDLTIRGSTQGDKGLDDVFKLLFNQYYKKGMGIPENGIQKACEEITGTSFQDFFASHVTGTDRIDYETLFGIAGLSIEKKLDAGAGLENVGVSGSTFTNDTITVGRIVPGSDAMFSDLKEGMMITAVNGKPFQEKSLDSYFNETDVPSKLTFSVVDHGDIVLTWSGHHSKFVYSIEEDPKATDLPLKTRDNWLRSRQ